MEIYIEKIIILNIFIHLLMVYSTIFLTNNKVKKKNVIIGIIIGVVNMYIYFLFSVYTINYLTFIIIPLITFKEVKSTILYIMFNVILGGITGVINISINYYYEAIILCSIIILVIIYILKNDNNKKYKIIINDNTYNCFYDTGCIVNLGLTPVIILSDKLKLNLELYSTMEVSTISGVTLHNVYKAKNVYLLSNKKIEKHCLIIISKIDYDVIIGKNFLGGL